MAKKRLVVKKPSLEAVISFAEGRTAQGDARRGSGNKTSPRGAKATTAAPNSRFPPTGDVRLTVNIRDDLHIKLKMAAVTRRTTVGEILEQLVEAHL
jgi:hypothetical protein